MILGDKEKFGVELEFTNSQKTKGHSRIWINKKTIGNFDTTEILAPLMNPLCASLNFKIPELNVDLLNSNVDIFELLSDFNIYQICFHKMIISDQTVAESFDSHAAFPAENFDHLFISEFHYENHRYFLWTDISSLSTKPSENQINIEKVYDSDYKDAIQLIKSYWESIAKSNL
jgi:hypothetical protein